jgi:hypothetical protein
VVGQWSRIRITLMIRNRIRIEVKTLIWIRVRIKGKIQELSRFKRKQWRPVDAQNGGVEAPNKAMEDRGRSKWRPGGSVGQWSRIRITLMSRIQIRIEVKSWIRIRIKVKKNQELSRFKMEPRRAVGAQNEGLDAKNGGL